MAFFGPEGHFWDFGILTFEGSKNGHFWVILGHF
jgi:hypothetical protein